MSADLLFGSNVDLNLNELRNAKIQILSSDPTGAEARLYYNSTTKEIKYYNGTTWTRLATGVDLTTDSLAGLGLSKVDADTLAVSWGSITGTPTFGQSNSDGTANTSARSDHTHALPAHDGAAHSSIKLSDLAAPTSAVAMGSQKITGLADGTAASDAATVGQVQAAASGLDVKASVRAASAAPVTVTYAATGGTSLRGQITEAPATLDGVNLSQGDRILLKNQAAGAENGIWVVSTVGTGADGVWDRATDFDSDAEVTPNAFVFVEQGDTNADSGWVVTTNAPITIGGSSGTALSWAQFSGAGSMTAGDGLSQTGTTFNVGQGTGISVGADSVAVDTSVVARKYSVNVGNGSATQFTVTHNLGTRDIVVSVREVASPYSQVFVSSESTTTNTATIFFASAPSTDQYRVTVIA